VEGQPENGPLQDLVTGFLNRLMPPLVKIAPLLKHPDFKEEWEWRAIRLCGSDDPSMDYHIKGAVAVPHSKVRLDMIPGEFPIDEIIVGPGPHQALAQRGITPLAFKTGVRSVGSSHTPLRNS
jgi:hypothetical protein